MPIDRVTSPLPALEWPSQDRAAWELAKQPVDLFDAPHRASLWKPLSWHKAEKGYGRWLNGLGRQPGKLLLERAEERIQKDLLLKWLHSLHHLAPMS